MGGDKERGNLGPCKVNRVQSRKSSTSEIDQGLGVRHGEKHSLEPLLSCVSAMRGLTFEAAAVRGHHLDDEGGRLFPIEAAQRRSNPVATPPIPPPPPPPPRRRHIPGRIETQMYARNG